MNLEQELLFNEKCKNLLTRIYCFKNIFTYACNAYSNIKKININLIMDKLYKNNFNYNIEEKYGEYIIYYFKYFKFISNYINNYENIKIKFINNNIKVNNIKVNNIDLNLYVKYNIEIYFDNNYIENKLITGDNFLFDYVIKKNKNKNIREIYIDLYNIYIDIFHKNNYINNVIITKSKYNKEKYFNEYDLTIHNTKYKKFNKYTKSVNFIKTKLKIYYKINFKRNCYIIYSKYYLTNKIVILII